MSYYNTLKAAEDMGVDRTEAANMRIMYLETELEELNDAYIKASTIIDALFIDNQRKPIKEEIDFLHRAKHKKDNSSRITDEDIQRARDYPIEKIIEFNQYGKALAFCHDDKNPSLSHWKKGNKARCFTCNKNFDSIAAAMELWGLSFLDAVRELS